MAVRQALSDVDGVASADVTFEPPRAEVHYAPEQTTVEALIASVEDAGFSASLIE